MELTLLLGKTPFENIRKILPVGIAIKESAKYPTLFLLKYDHVKADFKNPVLLACRGMILEKGSNRIICYPFPKFFNHGEALASALDWSNFKVREKKDGCLMKVYFYRPDKDLYPNQIGQWIIASNNTINSDENEELFLESFRNSSSHKNIPFHRLDCRYSYMFEMCHPKAIVVVTHTEPKIFHLGTRDCSTAPYPEIEADFFDIPKPPLFDFSSLDRCIQAASENNNPQQLEGYVICDINYARVKVKTPAYVNLNLSSKGLGKEFTLLGKVLAALDVIISGEASEFLAYFPEKKEFFGLVKTALDNFFDIELPNAIADVYACAEVVTDKRSRQKVIAMLARKRYKHFFSVLMSMNERINPRELMVKIFAKNRARIGTVVAENLPK